MKTAYTGGILLNDDFVFEKKSVIVSDGIITDICDTLPDCDKIVDCENKYLIPGFVDIHTHGALGLDCADELSFDAIDSLSRYYALNGVTTFLPTIATNTVDGTKRCVKAIKKAYDRGTSGSNIGGIYLEGPYFSKKYKGAQNPDFMRSSDISEFMSLYDASCGLIKVISLAPETENASEFIKHVSQIATVAAGHTDADYTCGKTAIENGASLLTHSFNAMRPIHHRNPGAISAFFDSDAMCEFIFDGIHVAPVVLKLMYTLLTSDRMIMVSDSISAAGMPDGEYELCGLRYHVTDGKARFSDGTIVGSTSNLHESVKNAVSLGIPFENAVKMASINPARASRIDSECGSITIGKRADMLLVDKKYDICDVVIKGKHINGGGQ